MAFIIASFAARAGSNTYVYLETMLPEIVRSCWSPRRFGKQGRARGFLHSSRHLLTCAHVPLCRLGHSRALSRPRDLRPLQDHRGDPRQVGHARRPGLRHPRAALQVQRRLCESPVPSPAWQTCSIACAKCGNPGLCRPILGLCLPSSLQASVSQDLHPYSFHDAIYSSLLLRRCG